MFVFNSRTPGIYKNMKKIPNTKKGQANAWPLYPRAESNRNRQNRNLKFYPLNYGGGFVTAKILFFPEENAIFAKCFEGISNKS